MKYYILRQSKEYKNYPQLISWMNKIDEKLVHEGSYGKIPSKIMIYVKPDSKIFFPDLLLFPFVMITPKVKECLLKYEPNMKGTIIMLVDKQNKTFQYYMLPFLKEIDCLHSSSRFNLDKSVITHCVLDVKKLPTDVPLFQIKGINTRVTIARMDFLETILRQDIHGIQLEEVDLV